MSKPSRHVNRRWWLVWAAAFLFAFAWRPALAQPASPDSLPAIVSRAEALRNSGDLPGARVLLLGIPERALDQGRRDTVTAARAEALMARIERDLNVFTAARIHDERAVALLEPDGRAAPALFRAALQHLVGVLRSLGVYDLALQHAERLLALRRATPGVPQAEIAASLASIASVLADLGRFEEATPRLEEAYAMQKVASGPDHPSTLGRLINLGNLAAARGDYAAAESLFTGVVEGRRRTYGPGHLMVAEALYNLALSHHVLEMDSLALCEGELAATIRRDVWRATIPFLPERAALNLTNEYWRGHEVALDAALAQERPNAGDLARLWHTALELRTLVLDETLWRQRERRAASDSSARQWVEWQATREALSRLVTAGYDLRRDPVARQRMDSLRASVDSLEWLVLARAPQLRSAHATRRLTWQEIADAVPRHAALVGCFKYGRVLRRTPLDRWRMDLRFQYAALVFRGDTRELKAVHLGDAGEIDSLVQTWVQRVSDLRDDQQKVAAETRRIGHAVRTRIWDPIARAIGPSSLAYVVPDGELVQLPWDALPVGSSRFLIDGPVEVARLFSERDVVHRRGSDQVAGRLIALGGPDFNREVAPTTRLAGTDQLRTDLGFACLREARTEFSPLPASGSEAQRLVQLWQSKGGSSTLLRGEDATVERFLRELPGATSIHVATHGFSLPDSCFPVERAGDQWLFEPLARYGLVFAGANRGRSALSETGSALLRASEIALLDLQGLDEVVLSTCRSGAGAMGLIEGVFGLSRAFRVAGTRRIVCSQWPVGDEASAIWMDAYGRARMISGLAPNQAARRASQEVLSDARRRGSSTAPRKWAAFAVWGDAN